MYSVGTGTVTAYPWICWMIIALLLHYWGYFSSLPWKVKICPAQFNIRYLWLGGAQEHPMKADITSRAEGEATESDLFEREPKARPPSVSCISLHEPSRRATESYLFDEGGCSCAPPSQRYLILNCAGPILTFQVKLLK